MSVKVESLTKIYSVPSGDEIAVDGIDMEIDDNEFLSLVGPSGCGKSTTLRCIAGLETPTSGRITISGEDVTDTAPDNRGLAMMFQDIALYPHMTVGENIAYPLKVRGISKEKRRDKAQDAAEIMRITELMDKYPGELSGGQRQRTALARTIVYDPRAFLMDEPLSDLDAKLKVAIRKEIQRVHERVEKPTIYVTHDQGEALSMSDRVAVMDNGNIMGIGTPDELYHSPMNKFVASFIGNPSMNFTVGNVVSVTEEYIRIEFLGNEIKLEAINEQPDGERIEIGFRPEIVEVSPDPDRGYITGTLELIERIGDRRLATIETPNGDIRALVSDEQRFREGTDVSVTFDSADIHLFDKQTGDAIAHGERLRSLASGDDPALETH